MATGIFVQLAPRKGPSELKVDIGSAWRCTSFQLPSSFRKVLVTRRPKKDTSSLPLTFAFHFSISRMVASSEVSYFAIVSKLITSPSLNQDEAKSSAPETLLHPDTGGPKGLAKDTSP